VPRVLRRALLTAFLFGCASAPNPPARVTTTPPPAATPRAQTVRSDSAVWVDSLLSTLTLEEKVGQMLMGRIDGDFENIAGGQLSAAGRQIEELGMGGFAVGIGSPGEYVLKINSLQRRSRIPLWFAADLEWGSAMRLWRPTFLPYGTEGGGGTAFPFNMGVAATGDPQLAEAVGRVTGREARAVGVQWVLAPVADVNTRSDNPIVNIRSYGSNPEQVSRYVAAFVRGATQARVLTAAKHFPGHGDTDVDSHIELPVLQVSRARLDALELQPFRAAQQAGVSAIMTGHLAVPALTGNRDVPTSVAPQTGTLLRNEMGFDGLIITDALTMGALRRLAGYSPGELAVRAVEAGTDVLLSTPDPFQARDAIVQAVRTGRITGDRIDASVRRILAAKAWVGLHRRRLVDPDSVNIVVASDEHERVAAAVARRSITLARDRAGLVPLDPSTTKTLAVIAFSAPNDLAAGRTLAAELRRIYGRVDFARLDENTDPSAINRAVQQAGAADAIVLATFLMPISGQGHLRVPARAAALADSIAARSKPVVTISFGDPYGPAQLPTAGTYLLAWQPRADHAQRSAARALAGLESITGALPVELPAGTSLRNARVEPAVPAGTGLRRPAHSYTLVRGSAASVGMSEQGLERVDSIITAALANSASPGAALAIGRHGRLVRLRGFGRLDYRPGFAAVTDSSLYDVASLTKVVATTSAAMLLVQEGRLDLDARVSRYLPEWSGAPIKDSVTVRHLLTHTAGLPAFRPFWSQARGKQEYLQRITALPLDYTPGTRMVYSDLGLITVGFIIERLTGRELDDFVRERVFAPLGMRESMFNPLAQLVARATTAAGGPPPRVAQRGDTAANDLLPRIAPTEIDTLFRKQHMHGRVHDENAFAMGGVSGHAGLFSSARDLAAFAQMLLNGGFYAGRRVLAPETIDLFRARQNDFSSRALGWDTPAACGLGTAGGDYFSAESIGHTGFTGTSLWIDFERDLFVVLLTNRVNPGRENQKHVPLRRAVHDAVQQALVDPVVPAREWVARPQLRRECQ
jgi:beta-N-acetylhexosaminidase